MIERGQHVRGRRQEDARCEASQNKNTKDEEAMRQETSECRECGVGGGGLC